MAFRGLEKEEEGAALNTFQPPPGLGAPPCWGSRGKTRGSGGQWGTAEDRGAGLLPSLSHRLDYPRAAEGPGQGRCRPPACAPSGLYLPEPLSLPGRVLAAAPRFVTADRGRADGETEVFGNVETAENVVSQQRGLSLICSELGPCGTLFHVFIASFFLAGRACPGTDTRSLTYTYMLN